MKIAGLLATSLIVVFIGATFSTEASAKCRGITGKTVTVSSEATRDGQRTATVRYDVTADLDICESGMANGPNDIRDCTFIGNRRLTRIVTVTVVGRGETTIGERIISLPPYLEMYNKSCDRVVFDEPHIWGGAHGRAISTQGAWQAFIQADAEETRRVLQQLGFSK